MAGLAAVVDTVAMPSTWPSGVALIISSAPIEPPPPALFSTSTCWPSSLLRPGATMRATMSVVPPGAKGTIRRIGLLGKAWARASMGARAATARTVFSNRNDMIRFSGGLLMGMAADCGKGRPGGASG